MRSTPSEPFVRPPQKSKEQRILFLSAFVGTGHTSAAEAVKKALQDSNPELHAVIVDSYRYVGTIFRKIASQGYIQLVQYLPQIYSLFYEWHHRDSPNLFMKAKFIQRMAKNLKKLLKDFHPDAIVCTHAFPSGVASILKEEFKIPVINIITDFTVHPFWIHPNTDLYLVGNAELAEILKKNGIPPKRIKVTGIPIDLRFKVKEDKQKIKTKLGLDPHLKTILIMGGGAGIGPMGSILKTLKKLKHSIQVIVATGRNRRLKKKMERSAEALYRPRSGKTAIKKVQIYGYVDNIHELMSAADLLITKPGGLTSSEALAAELPMVIMRPLPGQEIRNTQYLVKEKTAILAKKKKDLARAVDSLFANPKDMAKLRAHAKALKKPDAAHDAARHILALL